MRKKNTTHHKKSCENVTVTWPGHLPECPPGTGQIRCWARSMARQCGLPFVFASG